MALLTVKFHDNHSTRSVFVLWGGGEGRAVFFQPETGLNTDLNTLVLLGC